MNIRSEINAGKFALELNPDAFIPRDILIESKKYEFESLRGSSPAITLFSVSTFAQSPCNRKPKKATIRNNLISFPTIPLTNELTNKTITMNNDNTKKSLRIKPENILIISFLVLIFINKL